MTALDSSANARGGIYWIASYHKSGNTWFRLFLSNYLHDEDRPVDINRIGLGRIASSRGWIDETLGFDSSELSGEETDRLRPEVYRWSEKSGVTAFHKIHDAYAYLPDGKPMFSGEGILGAIYIVRNPLDVAVSFAHHCNFASVDLTIEKMGAHWSTSKSSKLTRQVPQKMISWSEHVRSWTEAKDLRVEIVRYEDMKADPLETFSRAIDFLGLPVDLQRIEKAIRFSEFKELKAQENQRGFKEKLLQAASFFRKGQVGDWKAVLSDAQVKNVISEHGEIMLRFGYLDEHGNPDHD